MFKIGYMYANYKSYHFDFGLERNESIELSNCRNLDLLDTSFCLVRYTHTFYNYTTREDTLKTFEDIKINGGDCFDYSNLYFYMARQLGYNSEVSIFRLSGLTGHAVAIISNEEGYCILDQLDKPKCTFLT